MSTLESIEKLRKWRRDYTDADGNLLIDNKEDAERATYFFDLEVMNVEHEIEARFMQAPVDADGIPWKTDDSNFIDADGNRHSIRSYRYRMKDGQWEISDDKLNLHQANKCRHVKFDNVRELLEELAYTIRDKDFSDTVVEATIENIFIRMKAEIDTAIADELRKLVML